MEVNMHARRGGVGGRLKRDVPLLGGEMHLNDVRGRVCPLLHIIVFYSVLGVLCSSE